MAIVLCTAVCVYIVLRTKAHTNDQLHTCKATQEKDKDARDVAKHANNASNKTHDSHKGTIDADPDSTIWVHSYGSKSASSPLAYKTQAVPNDEANVYMSHDNKVNLTLATDGASYESYYVAMRHDPQRDPSFGMLIETSTGSKTYNLWEFLTPPKIIPHEDGRTATIGVHGCIWRGYPVFTRFDDADNKLQEVLYQGAYTGADPVGEVIEITIDIDQDDTCPHRDSVVALKRDHATAQSNVLTAVNAVNISAADLIKKL